MNTLWSERAVALAPLRWLLRSSCVAFAVAGCGTSPTPILGCEESDGITPDCRFQNPEDLAPIANGLLVSQMMKGEAAGSLVYYDLDDSSIEVLFPQGRIVASGEPWGDAACSAPDTAGFAPHGIDLDQRGDGAWALYVVNHGGRESVEMFEVSTDGATVTTRWRGCVEGPERANFNDVVGLRDGGFWVTQQFDEPGVWSLVTGMLFGVDTGRVFAWHPGTGWQTLQGTEAAFPNGIEKSPDESVVYVNSYFGNSVNKVDVASGELLAAADVETPDNVTWSDDGSLLVASHTDSFTEIFACRSVLTGSCGYAFEVVELDAATMVASPVLGHRGAPMGAATVAVERDGVLYLGTFAGDRISRFRWRD